MQQVPEIDIKKRLSFDNPWWETGQIPERFRSWPRRAYFEGLWRLFKESSVRRAVVVMGPRRVGKTVMLTQTIQRLIDQNTTPQRILYVSVDTPTYIGLSLEKLLTMFMEMHGHNRDSELFVIFDEIQYLKDWEIHLKSLVDSFSQIRFCVSGSAAAALKMKSRESGAGRFTDFLLPPLNFVEFVSFAYPSEADQLKAFTSTLAALAASKNVAEVSKSAAEASKTVNPIPIDRMNQIVLEYVNFGAFPEAVIDTNVRERMDRYVAEDIIDKVILRDIPSLYGVDDIQELKRLFTYLAFNTGAETNYELLSRDSGISKNTIKKYLEYLESAFLVHRLYRIDYNARKLKRVNHFKVYLTNPSLRSALFGPVEAESEALGPLIETACLGQLVQADVIHFYFYARWADGEVDLVALDIPKNRIMSVIEVKWSDRIKDEKIDYIVSALKFCKHNKVNQLRVTTKSVVQRRTIDGITVDFIPAWIVCYLLANQMIHADLSQGKHPRENWLDPLFARFVSGELTLDPSSPSAT
jgi:hypothetical protein